MRTSYQRMTGHEFDLILLTDLGQVYLLYEKQTYILILYQYKGETSLHKNLILHQFEQKGNVLLRKNLTLLQLGLRKSYFVKT